MAKTSVNSPLYSLKGKIWFAAIIFAALIAVYRLIAYLIVSLIAEQPLYTIFLPFVFVVLAVVVFGWWLSKEIIRPVEKVALLAKSFERGLPTAPPKSSGSAETDELLQTLYRISQQTHKLVSAMDEVASGKLNSVAAPETNSDRLTQTFQKLLQKVSESIHAKQDLDKLQSHLARLSEELAPVRRGNLDLKITAEAPETREIVQTLNYLIEQMSEIVLQVKAGGDQTRNAALEFQKTVSAVVEQNENRAPELMQATTALRQTPGIIQQISAELSQSSQMTTQSIEKARHGAQAAQENLKAAGALRRQAQEAVKRIERLRERSQEFSRVAKTIDDLAQRASLLALNASAQTNESGNETPATGNGFVVVSQEIGRLATRAGETNKHISLLNQTLQAEISEAEEALRAAIGEAANLSKLAIETGGALSELERYIGGVLNLQDKIAAVSQERGEETERVLQIFELVISQTDESLSSLKSSIQSSRQIISVAKDLQEMAADFKVGGATPETYFKPSDSAAPEAAAAKPQTFTSYGDLSKPPLSSITDDDENDFSYNLLGE